MEWIDIRMQSGQTSFAIDGYWNNHWHNHIRFGQIMEPYMTL